VRSNTFDKTKKYFPCSIKDECFHLWEAAVNQPPIFYYGFSIKGSLNHETMHSALNESLEIHAKLKCVLAREAHSWRSWFQFVWESHDFSSSDIIEFLTPQDHGIELNRPPHYYRDTIYKYGIDISKEPGIKIFLITQEENNLLLFAFYHGVTDGRGGLNFIETFISEYNAIYFDEKINSQRISESTSVDNLFSSIRRHTAGVAKSLLYMLRHQFRVLRKPLIKIIPKTRAPNEEKLVIPRKIESEELARILALAKKRAVRFSDLLLAGIYFTIKKWNFEYGRREAGRVSIFASVGLAQGANKYVGNLVAGMALSLFTKDNMVKDEVLRNIAKEVDCLVKYNDAAGLLDIFQLMPIRLRQWVLRRFLKRMGLEQSRRFPTMRVANLGMLEVVNFSQTDGAILGDAKLHNIILSPANINEVPFLLFLTCRKEMYAYLVTHKSTFSYESGQEFLALLVRELSEF